VDRSAIFWAARLAVAVAGVVLLFVAARLVGRARAAANWPTAPPVAALSGPLGWAAVVTALLGLATAAGLSLAALAVPVSPAAAAQSALLPQSGRAWLLAGTGALAVLLAGSGIAGRLVNRAELAVLIRTRNIRTPNISSPNISTRNASGPKHRGTAIGEPVPAPAQPGGVEGHEPATRLGDTDADADSIVPSNVQPGWVYQDRAGTWYLVVATGTGHRLVRLDDFALVPAGTVEPPLTLRGSVEISVYPVALP
jgi:hypothetical protein